MTGYVHCKSKTGSLSLLRCIQEPRVYKVVTNSDKSNQIGYLKGKLIVSFPSPLMASPTVSYMRSLSFAPHSAWSTASVNAATRSQQLYHSINSHNSHIYTHHLHNFNSHHDRSYSHLHQFHQGMVGYNSDSPLGSISTTSTMVRTKPPSFANPSPSGAGGRRRSSSIRSRNPPPFIIKFDPFADEPATPDKSLTSTLAAQPKSLSTSNSRVASSAPYTIEIPAAGPAEMRRYAVKSPRPARRFSFSANDNDLGNFNGGGNFPSPIESSAIILPALSRQPPPPRPPSPSLRSSPSPPPARQPLLSGPGSLGGPNVSKLVAGILLNRMSVGKPIRRRVPSIGEKKEYVKSSLSSVVSVEA